MIGNNHMLWVTWVSSLMGQMGHGLQNMTHCQLRLECTKTTLQKEDSFLWEGTVVVKFFL